MTAHTHRRTLLAATFSGLLAAVLTACTGTGSPEHTPTDTGPYPAADIAPLTPAAVAPAPYEDTAAVQVARTTATVIAWANLTDTNQFAQFTQYIDPDSEPGAIGLDDSLNAYPYVGTGPQPFVVVSVAENADHSITVRVCNQLAHEVDKATGVSRNAAANDDGRLSDVTLSPLTDEETTELEDLGLASPPLRVRSFRSIGSGCDHSTATVQHFENWRTHAPIGHYNLRDPGGVTVVGEETPRAREDMP